MNRITFHTFDEILMRLSDAADLERVRRLTTNSEMNALRGTGIDSAIRGVEDTGRQIVSILRGRLRRRSFMPTAWMSSSHRNPDIIPQWDGV